VRSLSRCLAAICRHLAVDVVTSHDSSGGSAAGGGSSVMERQDYHQPEQTQHEQEAAAGPQDLAQRAQHAQHARQRAAAQQQQQQPGTRASSSYYGSGDLHMSSSSSSSSRDVLRPAAPRFSLARHAAGRHPLPASSAQQPRIPRTPSAAVSGTGGSSIQYEGGAQGLPYPPDLLTGAPFQRLSITVDLALVEKVLGPGWHSRTEAIDRVSTAGSAAGLVWTASGGMLQYIECCAVGRGAPGRPGGWGVCGAVWAAVWGGQVLCAGVAGTAGSACLVV
jgi:hypothetical protein